MELSSYLSEIKNRHQGILTLEEQNIFSESLICGAGAGGVGGWAYLALARLGCSRFKIAESGEFEPSNVNRQAGCTIDTIGKNKAEVIAQQIKQINPQASVEIFTSGINHNNLYSFLEKGSIVIDGIDLYELEIKKALFDKARSNNLPVVSCPILGFGAALAFFHPTKSPSFSQYFGQPPSQSDSIAYRNYVKMYGLHYFGFKPTLNWSLFTHRIDQGYVPSLGISCMLSGSMTATAIADYLLQKEQISIVPTTVHIDLLQQKIVKIGPFRRAILKLYISFYLAHLKIANTEKD